MKRLTVLSLVVSFSLGLIISCGGGGGGGDGETDTTAPSVNWTNPASDATGIQVSSSIKVSFDEDIKPSTATTGTFLVQTGGSNIDYSVSCTGTQITITPDQALAYETLYTVTLTTGIEDLSGNPTTSDYTFSFTTMPVPVPSNVVVVIPHDQEEDVPIDSLIEVVFREDMNPSTINQTTFYVTEDGNSVGGLLSYGSKRLTFTPTNYFAFGATVSATMTTGIQNLSGTGLSNDYSWDFQTLILHGSPLLIESNSTDTLPPEVAVDPDGNAMVIWGQWSWADACGPRYDIWANYYDNMNGWGTPEKIENIVGGADWYDIGSDDNGNFIAAWHNDDFCGSWESKIWACRYVKGIGWGTPEAIDPSTVDDWEPKIAVDPAGNAVVVWYQYDDKLWSNVYNAGVGWGTADTISSTQSTVPEIIIDSKGNATVSWYGDQPGCAPNCIRDAWAVRYVPGSGWGTPEVIDSSSDDAGPPLMGVDANGNALAVWGQGGDVWANYFEPGIGWGTAEIIMVGTGPVIAVDPAGNAIAVAGNTYTRYEPGSGWGTVQTLYTSWDIYVSEIALDQNGNGYAVAQQEETDSYNVWANKFTVGSGWSKKMLIGTTDLYPNPSSPQPKIDLDSNGNALVVWHGGDGVTRNIWANHIP